MADDEKKITPEEQAKTATAVPEKKEPDKEKEPIQPEASTLPPKQEAPDKQENKGTPAGKEEKAEKPPVPEQQPTEPPKKVRPSNVVEITGDMLDKIASKKTESAIRAAEKAKAAEKQEEKSQEPESPKRRGRPAKEAAKPTETKQQAGKSKVPKEKVKTPPSKGTAKDKAPTQTAPVPPEPPKEAPRRGEEQIVYLKLDELHAFKNHPFEVRDDDEMRAMVSSVKDKGVTQPAIVRPLEDGGYEIVSGHRRQKASEIAGFSDMPCIVRNLTDDEAITQMVEDNFNQREEILPSERAKALKMQLEAIKHQGARTTSGQIDPKETGKRSNEVVAERNKMAVKQVQRYIRLNELVPDLMKLVDDKKIGFTTAVELSYIKPKNQNYIAVTVDSQQAAPSQAQAKRMRELDEKKLLNGDVIDGIMLEDKKEVDKVILTGAELGKYFGAESTPREMKDQIIKLLDEWKGQTKEMEKPEKKTDKEK